MDAANIAALVGAIIALAGALTAYLKSHTATTTSLAADKKAGEATDNAYSAIETARIAQSAINAHVNSPAIPDPDPLPKGE